MTPPSIDEQLDAAAFRITNDGLRHSPEAILWAHRRLIAGHGIRVRAWELRIQRFRGSRALSANEQRVARLYASMPRRREW